MTNIAWRIQEMLPEWIDKEAWQGYVEMRRLKKKPMTKQAIVRTVNTLQQLYQEGQDITLVLNQSEDQGYTGVFPVSDNYYRMRGMEPPNKKPNAIVLRMADRGWAK
jgi:hypothetical protein